MAQQRRQQQPAQPTSAPANNAFSNFEMLIIAAIIAVAIDAGLWVFAKMTPQQAGLIAAVIFVVLALVFLVPRLLMARNAQARPAPAAQTAVHDVLDLDHLAAAAPATDPVATGSPRSN